MSTASLNGIDLATAVPSAELLRVRRPFTVPRHRTVEVPGRAGSLIFPDEPGDRIVTLELHIATTSAAARRAAVENLMGWSHMGAVSRLIVDDQPTRFEDAIVDASVDPAEWLTHTGVIPLPFRCGAYSLALTPSTQTLSAGANPTAGTFAVPDNVDARPVIEITPAGGGLTSFTLTVNGFALTWARTTPVTGAITVNSLGEVVTLGISTDVNLTGAYNPASVSMTDVSGFFPLLTNGTNDWSLAWTGTATSVALDVEWRERYLT